MPVNVRGRAVRSAVRHRPTSSEELSAAAWLQAMLDAEAALAGAEADVGLCPGRGRGGDRRRLPGRALRRRRAGPGGPGRREPGHPARRGPRGGGARGRPAVGAPRCHQPGHPRHRGGAGRPPRRWSPWSATCGTWPAAAPALAGRHRAHAHGGADAAAAGAADHLRAEGGGLAGGDPRRPAAPRRRRWPAGGAAGGRGRHARLAGRRRPRGAGTLRRRASGCPSPLVPWHTARQRIAELGAALAVTSGMRRQDRRRTSGLLAQSEVGEAAEPAGPGRGGSSTLPQKRNPVGAALARAAAARAQALERRTARCPRGRARAAARRLAQRVAAADRAADPVRRCGRPNGRDGGRAGGRPRGHGRQPQPGAGHGAGRADQPGALRRPSAATPPTSWWPTPSGAHTSVATSLAEELRGEPAVRAALGPGDERRRRPLAELLDPAGYLGATGTWIDRALAAHAELVAESADQTIVRPAR